MRQNSSEPTDGKVQSAAPEVVAELIWHRVGWFKREFAVQAGDTTHGTLLWPQALNSRAIASAAEHGHWIFQRKGPYGLKSKTLILGADMATFKGRWQGRGGVLQIPGGPQFHWRHSSWWHDEWVWQAADGQPLVRYKPKNAAMSEGRIMLYTATAELPQTWLLVFLGCYNLSFYGNTD